MAFDPTDPEAKAALKVAAEEAVQGLKAKNDELISRLKKAQKDATIDPADHAALQAELDSAQDKLSEITKTLKAIQTENENIKKQYETEAKVAHNLLVDTGLSQALLENGVKKASYLKAAKAMLASQVKLDSNGDERTAKVGDKPLADFIKEWAASDEGKTFVDAPGNAGGGAAGGGNPNNNEDLAKMSPQARLQAINSAEAQN